MTTFRLCPRVRRVFSRTGLLQLVEALLSHVTPAALEPIAEELEPVPLLPAVGDPRLRRVQREAVRCHPRPDQRESRFGLGVAAREDDEVVRIPHHWVSVFGHQPIQRIKIDIGQQRTDHRALRRACGWRPSVETVQDVGCQPVADEGEHTRPSLTRSSTRAIRRSCGIVSKYDCKSASTTWV